MKAWDPTALLKQQSSRPYAIIILNVDINTKILTRVLSKASLVVCADAGADRFRSYTEHCSDPNMRLPDVIMGDLDSVTDKTLEHYRSRGVLVQKDPDQYSSDLTKALKWIRSRFDETLGSHTEADTVILGSLKGRVDQAFSQIHHLYMADTDRSLQFGDAYLLSDSAITFLLSAGVNEIRIDCAILGEACGVIPLAGPTRISMTGFEWDIHDWPTEFGGQMSTSQYIRSDLVKVEVDGRRPIFTVELVGPLQE